MSPTKLRPCVSPTIVLCGGIFKINMCFRSGCSICVEPTIALFRSSCVETHSVWKNAYVRNIFVSGKIRSLDVPVLFYRTVDAGDVWSTRFSWGLFHELRLGCKLLSTFLKLHTWIGFVSFQLKLNWTVYIITHGVALLLLESFACDLSWQMNNIFISTSCWMTIVEHNVGSGHS